MSNDSTALIVASDPAYTREDLDALRKTIAKDCDEPQFKVFVAAFRRLGLDPFARQIVPIVQGGRMTPQTTIDGFRLIAERTRKYAGQIGPHWCGKDGVWREVWTDDDLPVAARVGVIRHDFAQPLYDVAHMRSYRKKSPTWDQLPIEMLAKVAEARALRRAFPQELSGVYTDDELAPEEPAPQRVVHADPAPIKKPTKPPVEFPRDSWGDLQRRAATLGIVEMRAYVESVTGKTDPKTYTSADRKNVADAIARREQMAQRSRGEIEGADFTFEDAEGAEPAADGEIPSDVLRTMPVGQIGA